MLSKKMTVSLTSLITIFVLAFIALPALAALEIKLELFDADYVAGDATNGKDAEQAGDYSGTMDDIQVNGGMAALTGAGDGEVGQNATNAKRVVIKLTSNESLATVTTANITIANSGSISTAPTVALFRVSDKEYRLIMSDPNATLEGFVTVSIAKETLTSAQTGAQNAATSLTYQYIKEDPETPKVLDVSRSDETSPFIVEDSVVFTVKLSEQVKGGNDKFTADSITVTNTTDVVVDFIGTEDDLNAANGFATDNADNDRKATGPDGKFYKYSVVAKPTFTDNIKFTVKQFEDQFGKKSADPALKEKEFKISPSKKLPGAASKAGTEVKLDNDITIPKDGYLIVARDDGTDMDDEAKYGKKEGHQQRTDSTYIMWPGDPTDAAARVALRKPASRKYNVIKAGIINLETFLLAGGTIDLIAGKDVVMISEIMWGTDGGSQNSQWIEIHNMTGKDLTTKDYKLMFYTSTEDDALPALDKVADRVATVSSTGYWSIVGTGQNGRVSDERKLGDTDIEIVATDQLISMQRKVIAAGPAAGFYADGTMQSSWAGSAPPGGNFVEGAKGLLIGTPGHSPRTFTPAPTPEPDPVVVPAALSDEIDVTEIMVDTASGRFPQWIELTYSGTAAATLKGWSMVIDNAIDAGVLGGGNAITIDLSSLMVDVSQNAGNMGKGQSVLVVAWATSRKSNNIRDTRVLDAGAQLGKSGRPQLLSANGFRITLVPPGQAQIAAPGDIVGNLHEDWEIEPPQGGARSSLIRYETLADGTATMGTDANAWVLASGTPLTIGQESFYGDDEDNSTPGQHAGGPLPVELSHFRPARDKATGAVVITWSTQSELNNAGFFIKRSQQRTGEFKVINATMVPGAGTTSEKQFYTYTDTTAQPNVVYYYQIEDVSLDGNRQTLTHGIRLKGHIGAAGKLTSTWGELKSSNE